MTTLSAIRFMPETKASVKQTGGDNLSDIGSSFSGLLTDQIEVGQILSLSTVRTTPILNIELVDANQLIIYTETAIYLLKILSK